MVIVISIYIYIYIYVLDFSAREKRERERDCIVEKRKIITRSIYIILRYSTTK
jgi:hypothetical protein